MMNNKTMLMLGAAAFLGLASFGSLPAMAQNDGSLPNGPKPAIKTDKDAPPAMPVPGKTSFTSDEARDRMMKRGYNITSNPLKDDKGIWYAEGQRDGQKSVMVMMDYQGNVYEGQEYTGHPSSAPGVTTDTPPPVKPINPGQR